MICRTTSPQNSEIIICGYPLWQVYICLEHTTYMMEYHWYTGPAWFRMPDEIEVFPEPDGHLGFLWDFFDGYNNKLGPRE